MSTLMEVVERGKAEWMDLVALVYDDGREKQIQTYKQLFSIAEQISCVLDKNGMRNSVIAVCRDTDLHTPSILCGILQSDCAFFTFDMHGMEGTIKNLDMMDVGGIMVQTSYTEVINFLMGAFPGTLNVVTDSYLSSLGLGLLKMPHRNKMKEEFSNIAYCITTSGTTGQRKLIKVPHNCIIPNITHIRSIYNLKSNDVVLLCSPLTFDPSIVEIFVTLSCGACLLIVPDHIKLQSKKLLSLIHRRNKVTVMQATPSLIQRLNTTDLKNNIFGGSTTLRILALGGEEFPPLSQIRSWLSPDNKTQLINLYGITEVSCWSFYHCLDGEEIWNNEEVPLGQPLSQSAYQILSKEGVEVLQGEGKLYLGGYDRQCIVDDKIQNFVDSGDFVRIDSHGRILFIGRGDRQVKRNGCRLNLVEIEKIALAETRVSECKVLMKEGKLVLFVVSNLHEETLCIQDYLKTVIKRKLPKHYFPDDVIPVSKIPITKHGKCDIKALLSHSLQSWNKHGVLCTSIENMVQWEWKKLLGCCVKTNDDNFLVSGGDSLTAVTLAQAIEDQYKISASNLLDTILHKSFSDIISCIEDYTNAGQVKLKKKRENLSAEELRNRGEKKLKVESIRRLWNPCCCINSAVMRGNQYFCVACMATIINANPKEQNQRNKDAKLFASLLAEPNRTSSIQPPATVLTPSSGKTITVQAETSSGCVMLSQSWRLDTGKCVDSSPLIVQACSGLHEVFIGSHSHHMYAVVAETGELLWKTKLGDRIESSASVSTCGNYIIVGCYDGGVYTLTRDTGEIFWIYKTGSAVKSSAAVDPYTGWIYIGSHDHHIYSLDIESQTCRWQVNIDGGSLFSSPSLCRDYVCACSLSGHVAAIHPTSGHIIWTYSTGKPVFSSPTITLTGPCVGCVDGKLYQLDHHGCLIWTFETSAPIFSSPVQLPVLNENSTSILVGSHDSCVYCVASDGRELWRYKTSDFVYSTCFCFGTFFNSLASLNKNETEQNVLNLQDNQFMLSDISNQSKDAKSDCNAHMGYRYCLVSSKDGKITVIETKTGQRVGSTQLPMEVFSSPVVIGNLLIVGCRDNNVYCFNVMYK